MKRISFDTYKVANPDSVERLAKWLGILPERQARDTNAGYHSRVCLAVCRFEKRAKRFGEELAKKLSLFWQARNNDAPIA